MIGTFLEGGSWSEMRICAAKAVIIGGGVLLTPFVAGRACQAALVGPELVEPRHTRQGFRQR